MAANNKSCSACLEFQRQLRERAEIQPGTLTCFAGLIESAVPVRVGDHVVAFLHVGQVLLRRPSETRRRCTARQLMDWGLPVDVSRLREAYLRTRVLSPRQYEGIVKMLTLFSRQLSMLSNQLVMTTEHRDPPVVEKAKHFIAEHVDDVLSLGEISRAVDTSTFYFCKLFRRATGLHFLDYVARVRVEKVKSSLLNPHMRISEAAYAAGFQSLSQFTRVFRRVVGEQPRIWREKLAH
jgi:AraC-like DNA-binding protein